MKKLSKLKLNIFREQDIAEKQMNALRGGSTCGCSCYWQGNTGANSDDNMSFNFNSEYHSTQGCNQFVETDYSYTYYPHANEDNPGYAG
jgi:natural product precursor